MTQQTFYLPGIAEAMQKGDTGGLSFVAKLLQQQSNVVGLLADLEGNTWCDVLVTVTAVGEEVLTSETANSCSLVAEYKLNFPRCCFLETPRIEFSISLRF